MNRCIELFAGIGSISRHIWADHHILVERDPFARSVLHRRFGDATLARDVTEYTPRAQRSTLVVGGFPCQDLSLIGKGAGIDGPRSGLWRHQMRIAVAARAECILWENVRGLQSRGGHDVITAAAREHGYTTHWRLYEAWEFGGRQRRPRLIGLSHRDPLGPAMFHGSMDARRVIDKRPAGLWQTPRTSSANGVSRHEVAAGNPRSRFEAQIGVVSGQDHGIPCPEFTEWVMGLPRGWTDPDAEWCGHFRGTPKPQLCERTPRNRQRIYALGNSIDGFLARAIAESVEPLL